MARTHFKAAIYDTDEGAGDVEAPLDLCDGALHVGPPKGFGKVCKRHGEQEELETHKNTHVKLLIESVPTVWKFGQSSCSDYE